jgi:molybdate transport system permease protein
MFEFSSNAQAIFLTIKLATIVTCILLIVATPLAWWLSITHSKLKPMIEALVALPIVLPPSVLGFYLLLAMGPQGAIGQLTQYIGLGSLTFTFTGLVIASVFYSLPFVVQPIQTAFNMIDQSLLEAAATLKANAWDRFLSIVLPLAKPGFLTASVLGFAHTMGEFGVVLMIGGNIPGSTRVVSVQIYDYVEALEYGKAHELAIVLLAFSFLALLFLYTYNRKIATIRI